MRFGVLGPLAVWSDVGAPVTVPGREVRALLADLLLHEGRPVSADRLVVDLWGDAAPADPTAALHSRVSQLRRVLAAEGGRGLVVSQPPGYAIHADAHIDSVQFTGLVADALAVADPLTRAGLLGEALGLWRGEPLADFADEEFIRPAVARWEERRLAALEAYAEARLVLGEHAELATELVPFVVDHPFRERLRAAHMRALYRSGRVTDALDSYWELRNRLADELGRDPGAEVSALHRALLAGDPAEDAPAPRQVRSVVRLPAPVAALIGRGEALARLRELIGTGRLVTVTGPAGVGKTSVALAVAWPIESAYPDGVQFVDLTVGGDPADAVLSVLAVPDSPGAPQPVTARLATALRQRRMLLVLDNCDHVVEPVAELVAGLLAAAPELTILATSREPLRVRGETRFDLPPLDIPDTDDPARLAESAAVRLFLLRAGIVADAASVAAAAEVCRRLDGLPLALELAATRVAGLGVPELVKRLSLPHDRSGLLATGPRDAPARQRALAAVIGWSWRLLSGPEQAVLRRLAVFAGGCTLTAAEAVCSDEPAGIPLKLVPAGHMPGLLTGLVGRSLVVRREGRYRLLEPVVAFCAERLREAGEEEAVRYRHADHYLELAEQADPELRGRDQRTWLEVLARETPNLRAAGDTYARVGAGGRALRLANAMFWYRYLRGRLTEAREALATALSAATASGASAAASAAAPGASVAVLPVAVARAWHAGLAIRQGLAGADACADALRGFDDLDDPNALARAQWFLAGGLVDLGDEAATGALLAAALLTFEKTGDTWGEGAVLSVRALLAHLRGDTQALEEDARRAAALFRAQGDEWGVLQATDWLIRLADRTGDHERAARLSRAGLTAAQGLGLWSEVAGRLGWLAWTSVQTCDYGAAKNYGERSLRLSSEHGQRTGEVFATLSLALAARRDGDPAARKHMEWLLETAREQSDGDPPYVATVLAEQGLELTHRGFPALALKKHRESFDVARALGSVRGMAWALAGMAGAVHLAKRSDLASELLGTADAVWRRSGRPLSDSDHAEVARTTSAVRAAERNFPTLFMEGAERTPEEARALLDQDMTFFPAREDL